LEKIIVKPNPKQKIAIRELTSLKYSEGLFDGGSRAGKTYAILMFFILMCLKFEGIRFLIARLRFNHVKANIWLQDFPKILPQFQGLYDQNNQDFIVRFPSKKSEIWVGGLDDKDRTEKILGQEYAGAFLNEATQLSPMTVDKVETRLAQNIPGFTNIMLFDCNPRHPQHFLYKRFYEDRQPYKLQLHWTPFDNKDNLPKGYIERLESKDEITKQRFLKGLWVGLPGSVNRNIKAENVQELEKDFNYYDDITGGIDFGLYSAVSVWGMKDNEANCLYEKVILNGKTSDIIKALDEIWGIKQEFYTIYCDHEPDRIQEICDAGYNAVKAYKDVSAGDATVNDYELYFDNECPNTYQSMLNLVHKQDNNGVFLEAHVKENDHEADTGRYAIHSWKMDNVSDYEPFIMSV
jgi:PBSX family phage terminase large subunit